MREGERVERVWNIHPFGLRVGRVLSYMLLVVVGGLEVYAPSPLLVAQIGVAWTIIWSASMSISAGLSLWGAVTDRWIGEYSGLPLLCSVLLMYGFSAIATATESKDGVTLIAFGLLIVAFACKISARWGDIRKIKLVAEAMNREEG